MENYYRKNGYYTRKPLTQINRCDFVVQNITDIYTKVLPHFDQYPLNNLKQLDFLDFREAILIMNSEGYLTKTGFDKIKSLKENMNNSRSWESISTKEENGSE